MSGDVAQDLYTLRVELACGMRLLHRRGLAPDWIAGHASTRVDAETILINRFGPSFGTVTPNDILRLDIKTARIVEGRGRVNESVRLHCRTHEHVPEIHTLVHTHSRYATSFSTMRMLPDFYFQESCMLGGGKIALLDRDHERMDLTDARAVPVAEMFGRDPLTQVVLVPNHGHFVVAKNLPEAFILTIVFENMCRAHMEIAEAAKAMGATARPITPEAAARMGKEMFGLGALNMVWEDALAKLRETDPDVMHEREHVLGKMW